MKRWRLAVALVMATTALTACWGISPIERRGLISLWGEDLAPGGGSRVTIDIDNATSLKAPSSAGGGGPSTEPVLLRSASATSPGAILEQLVDSSSMDLDIGHINAVVVSEALARQGLEAPLDFLVRSPAVGATPWLLVARGGTASALLQATRLVQPEPGEALFQTVEWARSRSLYVGASVISLFKQMGIPGDDFTTAGVVASPPSPPSPGTAFTLTGQALFDGDRLVGWLDGSAALGWELAVGRVLQQGVAVPVGTSTYTLVLTGARRTISVTRTDAGPAVSLQVAVRARLGTVQHGPADFFRNASEVRTLSAAAAATLTADVRSAVTEAQAAGSDPFAFGQYIRVDDPEDWAHLARGWETGGFRRLPVRVDVTVAIQSIGDLICPPLGGC